MGWLIALGVLVGLAILPIGIRVFYHEDGAIIHVIAGFLRFKIFPGKKKEKKKEAPKEKEKPKKTKTGSKEKASPEEKKGGSITDFLPLVNTALEFLNQFRKKLRINRLEMKLIMAGDDPCDLAVNYGRAWTAVGNLFPLLDQVFVIKKRNIEVECDFTADKTLTKVRVDLTITLGRILSLLVVYGLKLLFQYLNITKSQKGGASK